MFDEFTEQALIEQAVMYFGATSDRDIEMKVRIFYILLIIFFSF